MVKLKSIFYIIFTLASIYLFICHVAIVPFLISEHAQWGLGGVKDYDYGTTHINSMIL